MSSLLFLFDGSYPLNEGPLGLIWVNLLWNVQLRGLFNNLENIRAVKSRKMAWSEFYLMFQLLRDVSVSIRFRMKETKHVVQQLNTKNIHPDTQVLHLR